MKRVKEFIIDIGGWFASVWIFLFRPIYKPAVMHGFGVWYFARKYAIKRDNNWKCHWDQMGKQQGIFPMGETHLIVCSRLELKHFQKRKMISREAHIAKMFKRASYFKSQLNYK